jgi:hypothetical protein
MYSIFNEDLISKNVIPSLLKLIRHNTVSLDNLPRIIFLCGGQIVDADGNILPEGELIAKQNKRHYIWRAMFESKIEVEDSVNKNTIIPVVSEKVYDLVNLKHVDLLTFEEIIAKLSDKVILIVESEGTLCELGAFSLENSIGAKLSVINNIRYSGRNSFIINGPIRKLETMEEDKVIYLDYDYDLFKADYKLENLITSIQSAKVTFEPTNVEAVNVKNFMYEVVAILDIFGPLDRKEIIYVYKVLKGCGNKQFRFESVFNGTLESTRKVLDYMISIGIIKEKNISGTTYYKSREKYWCCNSLFKLSYTESLGYKSKILGLFLKNAPERMAF